MFVGFANLFLLGLAVTIIPVCSIPSLSFALSKNKIIDAAYSRPVPPPPTCRDNKSWVWEV